MCILDGLQMRSAAASIHSLKCFHNYARGYLSYYKLQPFRSCLQLLKSGMPITVQVKNHRVPSPALCLQRALSAPMRERCAEAAGEGGRAPCFAPCAASTKDIYLGNCFKREKNRDKHFIMQIVKCSIIQGTCSLFIQEAQLAVMKNVRLL